MPSKSKHFCNHYGCKNLVTDTYCEEHAAQHAKEQDKRRGSSRERGYTTAWSKYSKAYLSKPENQICRLHLDGCTLIARCVDHIQPAGPGDPLFWDKSNHQPACIHCNSVKGHTTMAGVYILGE